MGFGSLCYLLLRLSLSLSPCLSALGAAPAAGGDGAGGGRAVPPPPEDPFDASAEPVPLGELRRHPGRWLGRHVRFALQFRAPSRDRVQGMSRFGSDSHWAFEAWGDEQPLWEKPAFEDPCRRLFAPRGSSAAMRLRAARRYERFEVVADVGEVFLGEPWIEVLHVKRLDRSLSEGALVHASRAGALMRSERWYLAADQLQRALAGRLPEPARAKLEELRSTCLARHGGARAGRERPGSDRPPR